MICIRPFICQTLSTFYAYPLDSVNSDVVKTVDELPATTSSSDGVYSAEKVAELQQRRARRVERHRQHATVAEWLRTHMMHALVIAVRDVQIVPVLELLLPTLSPCAPVVVYSPDLPVSQHWASGMHVRVLQQLLLAHEHLRPRALELRLAENMACRHQVLPGCTHPLMQQQVTGGYILSGYTCQQR
jgi:hypothetical protein